MKTARLGLDLKLQIFFVHIGTAFDKIIDIYKINLLLYLNAIISRQVLLISLSQLVYYNTGICLKLNFEPSALFFYYHLIKKLISFFINPLNKSTNIFPSIHKEAIFVQFKKKY